MNPSPNLFLIGPMGAGKSSIGRRLAEHFGMPCIDLDAAVEQRTGTSVATIFEIEGEAGFRRRESAMLAELAQRDGIVLATGGGAVLASANRALLHERGFVVWLETSVEQQLRRLVRDRQRPLLDAPDRRERLEQLARVRDPLYREIADFAVASEGESCQHAAARIGALLEQRWQRIPATRASA
ncbi:MAG: Shikimate kinase I [Rhodanobacteraceae bacterium]|jgi:shikimate kinase|nr:MAG: Shikimate kinase I [Rhodanobacteraceae bacterium]